MLCSFLGQNYQLRIKHCFISQTKKRLTRDWISLTTNSWAMAIVISDSDNLFSWWRSLERTVPSANLLTGPVPGLLDTPKEKEDHRRVQPVLGIQKFSKKVSLLVSPRTNTTGRPHQRESPFQPFQGLEYEVENLIFHQSLSHVTCKDSCVLTAELGSLPMLCHGTSQH